MVGRWRQACLADSGTAFLVAKARSGYGQTWARDAQRLEHVRSDGAKDILKKYGKAASRKTSA